MPLLVSTTVDTPKGKRGIHLLDGNTLRPVVTSADHAALRARLGPAVAITEAQYLAFGGKR